MSASGFSALIFIGAIAVAAPAKRAPATSIDIAPSVLICSSDVGATIDFVDGHTEKIRGRFQKKAEEILKIRFGLQEETPWLVIDLPVGMRATLKGGPKGWTSHLVADDSSTVSASWEHPDRNLPIVVRCDRRGPGAL